jgi:hypothetical protein
VRGRTTSRWRCCTASSHLSGHVSGQILTVSGGMEGRVLYEQREIHPDHA